MGKPAYAANTDRITDLLAKSEDSSRLFIAKDAIAPLQCDVRFAAVRPLELVGYFYHIPIYVDPELGGNIIELRGANGSRVTAELE